MRTFRLLVLSLAALTLISACKDRKAASAAGAVSEAPGKKILQFGNGAEPQFVDPQLATGTPEHHLMLAFFEGLVVDPPTGSEPSPGVAETWKVSDDGLVYTFHLRPDAKWSDGVPLTSKDFILSYQRMLTKTLAADYAYMLFVIKNAEEYYNGKITDFAQVGFEAPDPQTLIFRLNKPASFLIHSLTHYAWDPVPIHVINKFGKFGERNLDWTRFGNFVGNGPFVMKEWLPSQKIVAARSPTYWDKNNVKLDEIHFHAIELETVEERLFRTGQLHVTNQVPVEKMAVYRREMPDSIRTDDYCGLYFYRLNIARKPMDDIRVRRALALSVDRERLVESVTQAGQKPAYSIIPPTIPGYTAKYTFKEDVAEAKRLLAEAGYPEGRGFPRVDILYNNLEGHRLIAEALQEMWRRNLGIEIGLLNKEWKVYLDDQKNTDFTMQRAGWIADYVDPHVFMDLWGKSSRNNNTNWNSPKYDELLSLALDKRNDTERYAVYQEMEKIMIDEMPIIPLYFYNYTRLVSPKVLNYRTTLLDNYPWKFVDLKN